MLVKLFANMNCNFTVAVALSVLYRHHQAVPIPSSDYSFHQLHAMCEREVSIWHSSVAGSSESALVTSVLGSLATSFECPIFVAASLSDASSVFQHTEEVEEECLPRRRPACPLREDHPSDQPPWQQWSQTRKCHRRCGQTRGRRRRRPKAMSVEVHTIRI